MERSCGTRFVQGNDDSIEDGLFGSVTEPDGCFGLSCLRRTGDVNM